MFCRLILVLCAFAVFLANTPVEADQFVKDSTATEKKLLKTVVADLYLNLASRPGLIPAEQIDEILSPAAKSAAKEVVNVFSSNNATPLLLDLAQNLQPAIDEFKASYSSAATPEEKGETLYRLHQAVFSTSDQFGTALELLNFALFKGLASFEAKLVDSELSLETRELIDLLLINSARQFALSSWLFGNSNARQALNVDPSIIVSDEDIAFAEGFLLSSAIALEQDISDPLLLADSSQLIATEFNQEARYDLALAKMGLVLFAMELARDPAVILQDLSERINSLGIDVSPQQIEESGINYRGLVYDWVVPEQSLSYQPDSALPELLLNAGGDIPQQPNLAIYPDPYLAYLQFEYDMSLANSLFRAREAQMISDQQAMEPAPLSMQDRFSLLQSDRTLRLSLLETLTGATEDEKAALLTLLTPAFI